MRVYIPDMTEFFAWMDKSGFYYVVLRGFQDFDRAYPAQGGKEDVDLLVEDLALPQIGARYHAVRKAQGVKCDIYSVSGNDHGDFLGQPYYPREFALDIIDSRRMWKNRFYVPGAKMHLLSLIYHIAYQKAEKSKLALYEPHESKYKAELDGLTAELGIDLPHTLMDFHVYLKKENIAIPYDTLVAYLQNDFSRDVKSLFLALVCAEQPGELNLFVIRTVAVETGTQAHLIRQLRQNYQILMVKDIPLLTRLTKSNKMRGGKWRRGGKPAIAVLVFDPQPKPTTMEDRKVHPFVLNARQFVKRQWRDWFTQTTGKKASSNPIHSTDNEAEAVGHFPLFFSGHEQEDIFHRLSQLRKKS